KDAKFSWVIDEPSSDEIVEAFGNFQSLKEGQIVELNLDIRNWFETVEGIFENGYLVSVDYGADAAELYSPRNRPDGTLRAFRRHEFVDDVLSNPGEYDITSSVDWTFVKSAGKQHGFEVEEFNRLDRFL